MHYEAEFVALLKFAFTLLLHVSGLIHPNVEQQATENPLGEDETLI